mgnify:CR=1 FL=1
MADLLSGLEKFGLDFIKGAGLFEEEQKEKAPKEPPPPPREMGETDYLFDKSYECPVCYAAIKARTVKTGKVRLLRTEMDLRPVYENFEPLKYDVIVCPECGYAVTARYFGGLANFQKEAIKEVISTAYQHTQGEETYTYEEAVERYKLSLASAVVKKAKASEKAYICLKSGWLLRSMGENLDQDAPDYEKKQADLKEQERVFLQNALDGLLTARQTENYPMCGMDQTTAEYLIAVLAMNDGRYDISSRIISEILASRTANRRIKDRARDVKDELIRKIREQSANRV